MVIFAFDFSINKPAATIWRSSKKLSPFFWTWPLSLTKKEDETFKSMCESEDVGFCFVNRDLDPISKASNLSTSEMALEHTKRSVELADRIVNDLHACTFSDHGPFYFVSEGLSFNSKGNSVLDLATYKGVLLAKIYEQFNEIKMFTYSPITIKSIAGCATKDKVKDKHAMIKSFLAEDGMEENVFWKSLRDGKLSYVKTKGKSAGDIEYFHCVDDIVDSYFAMKTLIKKEGLTLDDYQE